MASFVESVVALMLTLVLIGATVPLIATNTGLAAIAPEMLDEQQRARMAVDAISRDLLMAGAGISIGPKAGPLAGYFAPIAPRKIGLTGADAFDTARPDALTVVYVPPTGVQSVLAQPLTTPTDSLQPSPSVGCSLGTQVCGLQQGMTAVVYDEDGRFDLVGILSLQSNSATIEVRQQGIPTFAYAAGAAVAEAEAHTYYFDQAAQQLRHADGAHSDVPVVDNVTAVQFDYFGVPDPPSMPKPPAGTANCLYDDAGNWLGAIATLTSSSSIVKLPLSMFTDGPWCAVGSNRFDADLLRIRMVRVTVTVRVANPVLRARIPDYGIRVDIAPRNMNPGK
jgi:hypothetical protein